MIKVLQTCFLPQSAYGRKKVKAHRVERPAVGRLPMTEVKVVVVALVEAIAAIEILVEEIVYGVLLRGCAADLCAMSRSRTANEAT
jgi:hypothetical protein